MGADALSATLAAAWRSFLSCDCWQPDLAASCAAAPLRRRGDWALGAPRKAHAPAASRPVPPRPPHAAATIATHRRTTASTSQCTTTTSASSSSTSSSSSSAPPPTSPANPPTSTSTQPHAGTTSTHPTICAAFSPLRTTTTSATTPTPTPTATATTAGHKKRHGCLVFGFEGSDFYGLQCADRGEPLDAHGGALPTVSDALRQALLLSGAIAPTNMWPLARTKWALASRTDKGVHAAAAAVSLNLETLEDQLEWEGGKAGQWRLSEAELRRINSFLPRTVRIFCCGYVRKSFHARDCASSRSYEYLLPLAALDGASVASFDGALREFEGTHRFHNFASGLRATPQPPLPFHRQATTSKNLSPVHQQPPEFAVPSGVDSEGNALTIAWRLALDPHSSSRNSAACRTVVRCRVCGQHVVGGEAYVRLHVCGIAFALHQIRHMVGAALAVAHGVVPLDVLRIAIHSPFQVDVAPLAPCEGLLLDEVRWFSGRTGEYEFNLSAETRASVDSYKLATLYPHIHALCCNGLWSRWLQQLHSGDLTRRYQASDCERLRLVEHGWGMEKLRLAKKRRASKDQSAVASPNGAEGGRQPKPKAAPLNARVPLPAGLHAQLCTHIGQLPGPGVHTIMNNLRERVERGELLPNKPHDYYIESLAKASSP
ncbi:hypothetical protein AB1Y20_005280 [Prymnesium parvum]|uniref:Pseudouridine synthase I TruA alpha/beta domain-containing protein n=1 Tax=Prymnesium parvum TaxID=97485 RepID=A0AB34J5D4_PRYPA